MSKHIELGHALITMIEPNRDTVRQYNRWYEHDHFLSGVLTGPGAFAGRRFVATRALKDLRFPEASALAKPLDDGSFITGWDYPSCENIGLLKMDFLGLRNLTVMGDAIENIEMNRGKDAVPDFDTLPMDDPETYALLGRGDTLGVFQLDGGPMRDLLRRMQPTSFEDIVAVGALYRPGPMGVNAHNDYADRKNGRQEVKPIHPQLEEPLKEILGETHGLIVYQEQIMFIAQEVAGYSMGRADVLRKAMGKKKAEVLAKEFEGFQEGMRNDPRGFSDEAIQALWDTILPFAGYAFNKSHAAAYGLISYWTAYLKANFRAEYMAALLTSVGDNKDKSAVYLAECRRLGIKVLPPDVNESALRFSAVGTDIRFGLGAVRNVGANVVESIIKTRKEKGAYTSFTDFMDKSELVACNKRVIESLIKAGAFDSFGHTRLSLIQVHEDAVDAVVPIKRKEAEGQFDLFSMAEPETGASASANRYQIPTEDFDKRQRLAFEREMLGLNISDHPLMGAEASLRRRTECTIAELEGVEESAVRTIGGLVTNLQRKWTKKGDLMAVFVLEDLQSSVEVMVFPKTMREHGQKLADDAIVVLKGRLDDRDDLPKLIAMEIDIFEPIDDRQRPLEITLPPTSVTESLVADLKRVLAEHPGESQVVLNLGAQKVRLPEGVDTGNGLVPELRVLLGSQAVLV